MLFDVRIVGESPLIQHSVDTMLPGNDIARQIEEVAKRKPRTTSDAALLAELETRGSLWLNDGEVQVPTRVLRTAIEEAARKSKQGPAVREGMLVIESRFTYDTARYGTTLEELGKSTQFQAVVVVQRQKIVRTRAKFDPPWSVDFVLDCDDGLIDQPRLESWLKIAGQRIGIGDWRPSKSGTFGRFTVESLAPAA